MDQAPDQASIGSWLALRPLSGRTHQLRVHLQHMGHPIWGDAMYAPPDVLARAPRLLLHAQRLALTHPATGQALAFEHTPTGWLSPDMLRRTQEMPW
jgi:tRNA pseudouridine32 synthase/23S rRNA pseudouridine746 synthase